MTFLRNAVVAILVLLGGCVGPSEQHHSSKGPIRVLLLGDSISIGYTDYVREGLGERAVVVRPMLADDERAENCAGTTYGKDQIVRWLALNGGGFDVVHFNFGLHDLKRVDPNTGKPSGQATHPRQAELGVYMTQLQQITEDLRQSGARLIFATTTPVPKGKVYPLREPEDVVHYNAGAKELMSRLGVEVNDLYEWALPRLDQIQRPANVHFTPEGSQALAGRVVDAILR